MLFSNILTALYWICVAVSLPLNEDLQRKREINSTLVPSFGWRAGINPDGTGNCDGAINGTDGKRIRVPCQCPPNSTFFLAALNKNVVAGFVTTNPTVKLTFPTDNSTASQLARLNAVAVTLQNLEGPGIGCPISSTTFPAQQRAIAAEASNATSSVTPAHGNSSDRASRVPSCFVTPNSTTSVTPSSNDTTVPTDAQIASLAPTLGWKPGINPDGTGNCDGAANSTSGKPILIPCQCPPDQAHYISNLTANIRAGHVVLNPTILLTFPTDNSTASRNARLNAAAVTIQNLNGAGKGCPIASTNFIAQSKAINLGSG